VKLRQALPADLPAIAAIQKLAPEASSWNPLDYDCVVAEEEDGHIAGFIVTRRVAPDESEILNLAVEPGFRRLGTGLMLVEHALKTAPGSWFLEVRESNTGAITFYKSLGFKQSGRRPGYYSDPPEAAIVMSFFS
jgi:ribosomal-protein-alanine N-acetyltransferase